MNDTTIEAVADLPMIRLVRIFGAAPELVQRAHTDPELFMRWIGPDSRSTIIETWDARTGGSWRYSSTNQDDTQTFYGSFHEVRPGRIVQTFTWAGMPDGVALETAVFEDLGDGRTRVESTSLVDSIEARDGMLRSGMEVGVQDGYAKLDELLAELKDGLR